MKKLIWIDTETTGLDPKRNDIIQLAAIIEIDGKVVEEVNLNMQPLPGAPVSKDALKINGITIEQLKEYPLPAEQYRVFSAILGKYCDKFNRDDKFVMGGQNPKFDIDFLKQFFIKNGDEYFGSWFNYHHVDTVSIGALLKYFCDAPLPNLKLESLTKYLVIEHDAHDAMSDIRATREVFIRFGRDYLLKTMEGDINE